MILYTLADNVVRVTEAQPPDGARIIFKYPDPELHQNGGGNNYGRTLCVSDRPFDIMADHFSLVSTDPSMLTRALFGSAPAAASVGMDWQINGKNYPTRYTVHAGDGPAAIRDGVLWALRANTTLIAALESIQQLMREYPAEQEWEGVRYPCITFDAPHFSLPSPVGQNVQVRTFGVDNGPLDKLTRFMDGYQFKQGDEICARTWEINSGPHSGIDMTAGKITMFVTRVVNGVPRVKLGFGAATDQSPKNALPSIYVGDGGVRVSSNDGNGNDVIGSVGDGNFGAYAVYFHDTGRDPSPLRDGMMWRRSGKYYVRINGQTRAVTISTSTTRVAATETVAKRKTKRR